MYQFILIIHVFVAVFIVGLVLVQQGKGATVGAAFGSGASQTVFGSRGSGSFLLKVTIALAIVFFGTSIVLNNMATRAVKKATEVSLPATLPAEPASSLPTEAPLVTPGSIPGIPADSAPVQKNKP